MKDLKETKNLDLLKEIAVKINSGEEKMELSDDALENISGGFYSVKEGHQLKGFGNYQVVVGTGSDGKPVTGNMSTILYYGTDKCGFCGNTLTTNFFECYIPDVHGNKEVVDVCESCLRSLT